MPELKQLHKDAIPAALEKAERYRLLNEPAQAESICLDVLAVDPDNQRALIILLVSLSDQFQAGPIDVFSHAQEVAAKLHGEYERLYYSGILWERRGLARAV